MRNKVVRSAYLLSFTLVFLLTAALAQTPSFDPANYSKYFNDPELQEYTRVKAVSDCFEPGSIFKPITLAICLQANEELKRRGKKPLFSPDEKIPTSNGWFPGRSTPLKDGRPHNFLNMNLGIIHIRRVSS